MHIKRFTGRNTREVMRAVKDELGSDALILSNKKADDGIIEVVAAVEYDLEEAAVVNIKDAAPATAAGVAQRYSTPPVPPPLPLKEVSVTPEHVAKPATAVEEELRELKELCWAMMGKQKSPVSRVFATLENEMVSAGIDTALARKIITSAWKVADAGKKADPSAVRDFIKTKMMGKMNVVDPASRGGVLAFVGPTGVGKTTTIAKIAAIQAIKKKRSVALLSMDTYRIAAADQLKRYGRIIGVPVDVASTARELNRFIQVHSDKDLVLVDTAGRNHRERAHMGELATLRHMNPKMRMNLVLSAQSRDRSLYDAVRGFGALDIDSLTFTKLDEGDEHGSVLNAAVLAGRPVAYLTNGQRVPEDIELATRDRLVNFMLRN